MKKLLLVFVVVCSFFLVGCSFGKQKLVCKQKASGVDIEFNVGFFLNRIKTIDFNYDMDLASYSDKQISMIGKQDFCSIVKQSMKDYKNAFNQCKQKISGKHLKVYADLDVNKLDKSISKKMTTPKDAKKELEKTGYACKIK